MSSKRELDAEQKEGTKRPKLPNEVMDLDVIHYFDNARRFQHKEEKDTEESDSDDGCQEFPFVEFYWNNDDSNMLKRVEGVHKQFWERDDDIDDEEEEDIDIAPNSTRFIPAPSIQEAKYDDVAAKVEQEAKALIKQGYKEVKDFLELHKIHLPCFTWIVSEEAPPADAPVVSSQIGGYPAMYKSEKWPDRNIFAFQIDLSEVPTRMQCIVGSEGLLQLFWNNEDELDEGFARIIPPKDFDKLERRNHVETNDQGPERNPQPGQITAWVERPDYPKNPDIDGMEHLVETCGDLQIQFDKFGGYGTYCQGEGEDRPGNEPCEKCGKKHLFCRETFHMYHCCMLRFALGDLGTARLDYCPNDENKEFFIDGSCY